MQPQKRGNMKIKILAIFIFIILGLASCGFVYNQYVVAPENILHQLSQSVYEQAKVASIDNERQTSIEKIVKIISRYNKKMDETTETAIANEIYVMSRKFPNLNIDFICATITHESAKTWDPKITSKVGAMGLMQVMPTTGAFLAVEEGLEWTSADMLYDPITNIRLGCRYLSEMVKMYEKDGGLAAYNGGPKRAEMWLAANRNNKILYAETRAYVPAVMKLYKEFRLEDRM